MFKGDEKSPEAIVQKVNAEERTAEIQIVGEEEVRFLSAFPLFRWK